MSTPSLPRAPRDLAERIGTAERRRQRPAARGPRTLGAAGRRVGPVTALADPRAPGHGAHARVSAARDGLPALWLYFKSPARYIGFMWWLWFLSPEVRRLADWSQGRLHADQSDPGRAARVTMISALSLMRHYRVLDATARPAGAADPARHSPTRFMIGVVSSGPLAATYDLANWLYPILIGFHIMAHTRDYPAYRETILNTFIWGMLVMGAYGIVQFFIMPPWDALWMLGSQMNSQGDPVPMGVRVFSTMNSSGPFALVAMMGAMVFVMAAYAPLALDRARRWASSAFGLSLVRSTWGGWVIALLMQLVKSNNKVRLRIVAGAVLLAALCVPLLAVGPVADRMQARV